MKSYIVTLLEMGLYIRYRSVMADDEGEALYKAKQEIPFSTLINIRIK